MNEKLLKINEKLLFLVGKFFEKKGLGKMRKEMRKKKVKFMKVFNCNQVLIVCILNFYY